MRMALLRWIARKLGASALLAPIPLSAQAACATERRMIERLAALGIRVPVVIDAQERELLLSDLGPTLACACRAALDENERESLLRAGFAALAELHRRGGYVSQAFARNLAWSEGMVGFIDLEEDPCEIMPLVSAQVRDTLFFVYSTARFLPDDVPRYRRLLDKHLADEPPEVRSELFRTMLALRWLAHWVKPFGKHARHLSLPLEQLLDTARRVQC